VCTPDLGCTGGNNDIAAGTDTDFVGACTPALRRNYGDGTAEEAEQRGMFSFCVTRRGKFLWSEYYLKNITKPRVPYLHIRLLFNHIHSLHSEVLCVLNHLVLFTCSNQNHSQ